MELHGSARRRRWHPPAPRRSSSRPRPPTSPTLPSWSIVPVAATIRLPVRRPLLSLSMMPSVMARPADGPPMFCVCTVTLTGNCQSCCVCGSIPRIRRRLGRRPAAGVDQSLGRRAERHRLGDDRAVHEFADVVDGGLLDLERDARPGRKPVQRVNESAVGRGRRAVHPRDDLGHLQRPGRRRVGLDPEDQRARVGRRDRVAEVGQRGRGGEGLGLGHLEVPLVEVLALVGRGTEQSGPEITSLSESKNRYCR